VRTTTAGYSRRPLVAKLGIKAGATVAILNAPRGYDQTLGKLPSQARRKAGMKGPLDLIQFFTKEARALEREFGKLERALAPAGMLWVSWPKKASGVATDVTEEVVRATGLAHGLVDLKVAAVDEKWSGLKFVRRLKDRAALARA